MGWVKVVAIAVRWTIAWTESLRHGSLSDCVCVQGREARWREECGIEFMDMVEVGLGLVPDCIEERHRGDWVRGETLIKLEAFPKGIRGGGL